MRVRQLEFLITITELGSISACADYFGVTQPTVTNQIHQLEEDLSTKLLIRSVHGTTLTAIGERVVLQAKKAVQEINRIGSIVEETKKSITGKVVLGVSPLSPLSIYFPRIFWPFHNDFPDIQIEVIESEALNLADQVRTRKVDLALTPLPLFTTKMQYELLWEEELVVISKPDSYLKDHLSMDDLRDCDFVFMRPGYSLNLTVSHLAQRSGFEPHIVTEASSIHALLGYVASGIGIAVVPKDSVSLEAKAGLINVSYLSPVVNRRFAMVFRDREHISPAVQVFMRYIRLYARDRLANLYKADA